MKRLDQAARKQQGLSQDRRAILIDDQLSYPAARSRQVHVGWFRPPQPHGRGEQTGSS
jgi:hypothetical protein